MSYLETVPFTEAQRRLGVSRSALYRAFTIIENGEIQAAKFGGVIIGTRRVIRRRPFEPFMAGCQPYRRRTKSRSATH